jgi:hypothetical protein
LKTSTNNGTTNYLALNFIIGIIRSIRACSIIGRLSRPKHCNIFIKKKLWYDSTMLTDEELQSLPRDDDEALIAFEDILYAKLEADLSLGDVPKRSSARFHYVEQLLAFTEVYNPTLNLNAMPVSRDDRYVYCMRQVQRFKNRFRLKKFKKSPLSDVTEIELNDDYKIDIHNHLNSIRKIVSNVDLTERKRDAILIKIAELSKEVDKSKTKTESLLSIWLDVTTAASEGAENLDPLIKRLEKLANIFGKAKDEREQKALEAPEKPKLLPSPEDDSDYISDDESDLNESC